MKIEHQTTFVSVNLLVNAVYNNKPTNANDSMQPIMPKIFIYQIVY